MKPTEGKLKYRKWDAEGFPYTVEGATWQGLIASIWPVGEAAEANAALIVAAWNACVIINPDDPIRAAEKLPAIVKAAEKLHDWFEATAEVFNKKHGNWQRISAEEIRAELFEALQRATETEEG